MNKRKSKKNISNSIKDILGQLNFVNKKKIPKQTQRIINSLHNNHVTNKIKVSKQNKQNVKSVNKLTNNLISTCNKILIRKENDCQCFDKNGHPVSNFEQCKNNPGCEGYNKCRKIFKTTQNGYEPNYNPDRWKDPLVEGTHNCYMYFLNDQKDKLRKECINICKNNGKNNRNCRTQKQNSCSNLKPQPGNHAFLQGNFRGNKRVYSCPAMIDKVLKDNYNKGTNKSNIIHWDNLTPEQQFIKKCPENYYKGVLVVHPKNTYHFYRQDKNGRYSHKQGTLAVENMDASKRPIYVPHLSDMNYSKGKNNGINYTDFCGYMCIPNNMFKDTHAN